MGASSMISMITTPGIGVLVLLIIILFISLGVIRFYVKKSEDRYTLAKVLFIVFAAQSIGFWVFSFFVHEMVIFIHTIVFKVINTATIFSGAFLISQVINKYVWSYIVDDRGVTRIPSFIKGATNIMIYLMAVAIVIRFVFIRDEGSLVVFTGASALLFGYAAKEIIAHIFSALALNVSPSFRKGDLIIVDDKTLRVDDMNWRFVKLVDFKQRKFYVPNTHMTEKSIINLSQIGSKSVVDLEFELNLLDDPEKASALIKKNFAKEEYYNDDEDIGVYIENIQNCLKFKVRVPIKGLKSVRHASLIRTELYMKLWKMLKSNKIHFYISEMHVQNSKR